MYFLFIDIAMMSADDSNRRRDSIDIGICPLWRIGRGSWGAIDMVTEIVQHCWKEKLRR